jgi:crotonobetainyl-CoA:carnitine CoA-transferase CaiB-like acyl-CoA transferase
LHSAALIVSVVPNGDQRGLLTGVRVLDLSIWRPGPYATQLLVELGADVVKVEPPGGDPMRVFPTLFDALNAGKRSAAVDLKDAAGRAAVLELARGADVVVEGFRPGVVRGLGVDYESVRHVNPSVVYCSISGYGQDGPLAQLPGHDLNYQAWAGVLAPAGGAPVVPAVPIADLAGGMAAAMSICAAVVRQIRTGEGERIDVAMTDVLATWTGAASNRSSLDEDRPEGRGGGVPGYGTFETADGHHVALGVLSEDHFWRVLCGVLVPADVGEVAFAERLARIAELQALVRDAIRARPAGPLVAELLAADVPVAPVADRSEMLANEHLAARGVVTSDPWAPMTTGHPVVLHQHPATRSSPPPGLDEHRGAGFAPR